MAASTKKLTSRRSAPVYKRILLKLSGEALLGWMGVTLVLLLCLPAIFGGVAVTLALLAPDPSGPATIFRRPFVALLEKSILTMGYVPATLIALAVGAKTRSSRGSSTPQGRAVAVILVIALVSTIAYFARFRAVMMTWAAYRATMPR